MSAILTHGEIKPRRPDCLAGAGGFEPPHGGIKSLRYLPKIKDLAALTTSIAPEKIKDLRAFCLMPAGDLEPLRHGACGRRLRQRLDRAEAGARVLITEAPRPRQKTPKRALGNVTKTSQ